MPLLQFTKAAWQKKRPLDLSQATFDNIVAAHTGLEPVISALRGQRVNRLHQCAAADWNYRCAAVAEASWRVRRRRSQFCNGSSWMRSVPQRGSVRSASSINIFIECAPR